MAADDKFTARWASQHGLKVNEQGCMFLNGSTVSFDQKVQVAAEYTKARSKNCGLRPDISALARRCRVSREFVRKFEAELVPCGCTIDPETLKKEKDVPCGVSGLHLMSSHSLAQASEVMLRDIIHTKVDGC